MVPLNGSASNCNFEMAQGDSKRLFKETSQVGVIWFVRKLRILSPHQRKSSEKRKAIFYHFDAVVSSILMTTIAWLFLCEPFECEKSGQIDTVNTECFFAKSEKKTELIRKLHFIFMWLWLWLWWQREVICIYAID